MTVRSNEKVAGLEAVIWRTNKGNTKPYYFPRKGSYFSIGTDDSPQTANIKVKFGEKVELRASVQGISETNQQECLVTLPWESFEEIVRMFGKERRGKDLMLKVVSGSRR